jgi:hypothetical protein
MMMQPYRLSPMPLTPHTCLDPPRVPCAARPARERLSVGVVLIAVFGIVAAVGGFMLRTVGYGGHVEISPHALALLHKTKHDAPPKKKAESRAPTASNLVPIRPWLGGGHDPARLLARAREMQGLGLDMTVIEVPFGKRLAHSDLSTLWPESLPIYGHDHHVDALELRKVPTESLLRVAGVADGDELLGIDGYRFDDDTFNSMDTLPIQKRGWVVVELGRARHHVVLSLRWN